MEIERKYLIEKEQLPADLASYPFHKIEQGYLCTSPVPYILNRNCLYIDLCAAHQIDYSQSFNVFKSVCQKNINIFCHYYFLFLPILFLPCSMYNEIGFSHIINDIGFPHII